MRASKYFLMALLVGLIASCSLVKTSYNNAPALTIFWLDDYFSFSQAQNLALKPSLQKLHQWHRQSQLPIYITLLQDMQTSFAKDQISAAEACEKIDAIKLSIRTVQLESIPIIVEMAPQLSDKQLTRFQQKLEKRSEKWKEDWWQESKQEQLAVRIEKTEDFAQKMYGNLSEDQLNQLKQRLAQANINPEISYKEILRRNDDAFTIISSLQNSALSPDEKSQLVKAGFNRIQKSPDLAYQSYADALTKHTCETMANLHASTNEKQKLHAKNWLQDYIDQLTALQIK
jgi:Family of unknown function (DUF6279)